MNKAECLNQGLSSRMIGLLILPFALFIGFIGAVLVPVVGFVFAAPLLLLAGVFVAAPQSRACKLLLG
jgi:hypothetical protein